MKTLIETNTKDGKLQKPLMKYYLKVMERSLAKGRVEYVSKETERLIKLVSSKDTVQKQRMKFAKRINILSSFLSPAEKQELMAKKKEEQEGGAKGGEL